MADALTRIVGPSLLTAAAATVYTTPAATTTTVRAIHVTNESGSTATFTLSVGTDAAGKRFFYQVPVANGDMGLDWTGSLVLAAGDVLQAYSGTASALTLTMSAVVTT